MGKPEVETTASLMDTQLMNRDRADILDQVSKEVPELCKGFPVYVEGD